MPIKIINSKGKLEPGLPGIILQKTKPSSVTHDEVIGPTKKLFHPIISHGLL